MPLDCNECRGRPIWMEGRERTQRLALFPFSFHALSVFFYSAGPHDLCRYTGVSRFCDECISVGAARDSVPASEAGASRPTFSAGKCRRLWQGSLICVSLWSLLFWTVVMVPSAALWSSSSASSRNPAQKFTYIVSGWKMLQVLFATPQPLPEG